MNRALDYLGSHLKSLPTGEIGKKTEEQNEGVRLGWMLPAIESIVDAAGFELKRSPELDDRLGIPIDYDHTATYKLHLSPRELEPLLNLLYIDYYRENYELFKQLRSERGLGDLRFQIGMASAISLAIGLGFPQGLKYRKIFERRLAYEANQIHEFVGNDGLFQYEAMAEIGILLKAPGIFRPFVGPWLASSVTSFARQLHPGTHLGVHLCFGDLSNLAMVGVRDIGPLVTFANQIASRWPDTLPLEFIHFPLAEGFRVASVEEAYYRPFKKLNVPENTRVIAGFIHEGLSESEHRVIIDHLQRYLDRDVEISSSCGLGRRTPEVANQILGMTQSLVS